MELMYQVVDQMLMTGTQAVRSNQTAQSADRGNDFGSMVRQKQQQADSRASDSGTQKAPAATKNSASAARADTATQGQDVSDEQYVVAAAMVMDPGIEWFDFHMDSDAPVQEINADTALALDIYTPFGAEIPIREESGLEEQMFSQDMGQTFTPEHQETVEEDAADTGYQYVEAAQEDTEEETVVVVEDIPVETPVFGEVEATPVQVAQAPAAPVEIEADDGMEQLAGRIQTVLTDSEGNQQVEFTLIPESLGKVRVTITHAVDGTLHIQLSATTLKAATLLERNSDGLRHLLSAPTRPEVEVEVRGTPEHLQSMLDPNGQQEQQRQQQQQRRQQQQHEQQAQDFIQQLRLGLVDLSGAI